MPGSSDVQKGIDVGSLITVVPGAGEGRFDLVLSRPEVLNALNVPMLEALNEACASIRDFGSAVRVVVVRSSVPKSFCVGADINEWEQFDILEARRASLTGMRSFGALADLPMPVVALISGYCFGGGLELALACDLRVVSPPARLAFPEASLGTGTGWGGLPRLVRLIGPGRAKAMLFAGRELNAAQAQEMGVCEFVVDTPEEAEAIVAQMARNAPLPLEIMKRTIDALDSPAGGGFHAEALSAGIYAATEDARRAKAAFRSKGPDVTFEGA